MPYLLRSLSDFFFFSHTLTNSKMKWKFSIFLYFGTKILWQGIAVTVFVNIVTSWCVRKRGPLYASVFNPLALVIVAPTASLLLQNKLYLGTYALFLFHHFFP